MDGLTRSSELTDRLWQRPSARISSIRTLRLPFATATSVVRAIPATFAPASWVMFAVSRYFQSFAQLDLSQFMNWLRYLSISSQTTRVLDLP
jgi:hypothetical protein